MDDQQFDLERNGDSPFLANRVVQSFHWKDLTVTVKDRRSGNPLNLITEVNGYVKQGITKGKSMLTLSQENFWRLWAHRVVGRLPYSTYSLAGRLVPGPRFGERRS